MDVSSVLCTTYLSTLLPDVEVSSVLCTTYLSTLLPDVDVSSVLLFERKELLCIFFQTYLVFLVDCPNVQWRYQ